MKKCSKCHTTKSLTDFHKNASRKDGLDPRCKQCRKTIASLRYKENWYEATIKLKKSWCSINNVAFNLTADYLKSIYTENCPITGVKFEKGNKKSPRCPNLDRIDSTKGYTKGNVQYISARCNRIKDNATLEELERIVAYLKKV